MEAGVFTFVTLALRVKRGVRTVGSRVSYKNHARVPNGKLFTLLKPPCSPAGLTLDKSNGSIKDIKAGSQVELRNSELASEERLRKGDMIVAVNGIVDAQRFGEELRSSAEIEIRFRGDVAPSPPPPPSPSAPSPPPLRQGVVASAHLVSPPPPPVPPRGSQGSGMPPPPPPPSHTREAEMHPQPRTPSPHAHGAGMQHAPPPLSSAAAPPAPSPGLTARAVHNGLDAPTDWGPNFKWIPEMMHYRCKLCEW